MTLPDEQARTPPRVPMLTARSFGGAWAHAALVTTCSDETEWLALLQGLFYLRHLAGDRGDDIRWQMGCAVDFLRIRLHGSAR